VLWSGVLVTGISSMHRPGSKLAAVTTLAVARKVIVAVIGSTVVVAGIALIVLPGPAIIVIPLGLTILATEFLWARRLVRRIKQDTQQLLGGRKA
jgi:hypothetical protein